MGRPPIGDRAMTAAERMRRHRAKTRNYALHLAMQVRKRGEQLVLSERYGPRRKIGTFQTWKEVERAIRKRHDEMLVEVEAEIKAEERAAKRGRS
jgi:hypothetical protein